jgi:hypothetical protein
MLKSIYLKIETKGKLCSTMPKPVLTYGSESWILTNGDEQKLRTFERNVLRKIYGPIRDEELWRIKYSHQLYDLYNAPEVVETVKLGRLRWLGHLTRANETSPLRKHNFPSPKAQGRLEDPAQDSWVV